VPTVGDVLVLNADFEPLQRVSLRHAIRMLVRQVAEVHDAEPDRLIGVYPMPLAVRLVRYVYAKWRLHTGPPWSRLGVLARDGHRCGYCGGHATTIDHILPRSRGGTSTWENCVLACIECNKKKADRTPKEAHLKLHTKPARPKWQPLYATRHAPVASWTKFISEAYWNVELEP
jgi:5-methylcytosine-specific restriction endonuclease McrA